MEESDLDLIVSGTEEAVVMIEGFAREMPEDVMAEAIAFAHGVIKEVSALAARIGREGGTSRKAEFVPPEDDGLFDRLKDEILRRLQGGQADARASRPAPTPSPALKERAMAEMIPDPEAEGAIDPVGVRRSLARSGSRT